MVMYDHTSFLRDNIEWQYRTLQIRQKHIQALSWQYILVECE